MGVGDHRVAFRRGREPDRVPCDQHFDGVLDLLRRPLLVIDQVVDLVPRNRTSVKLLNILRHVGVIAGIESPPARAAVRVAIDAVAGIDLAVLNVEPGAHALEHDVKVGSLRSGFVDRPHFVFGQPEQRNGPRPHQLRHHQAQEEGEYDSGHCDRMLVFHWSVLSVPDTLSGCECCTMFCAILMAHHSDGAPFRWRTIPMARSVCTLSRFSSHGWDTLFLPD